MLATAQNFIPVLNSEAGLCLTKANWQEVNINSVSYFLEHLLYKPGMEVLKKCTDLSQYFASPGKIIINAGSLLANKEGIFVLKSPYDGSNLKFRFEELIALIQHLKPDAVILPQDIIHKFPQMWESWDEEILAFIHMNDLQKLELTRAHGVYAHYSDKLDWDKLKSLAHLPRYVMGFITPEANKNLMAAGIDFVETDEPAKAAMLGKVYARTGIVDLTDANTEMQFQSLDENCLCPTCTQGFTRAYLHHLYQHTPLLCYRFLLQHNIFYIQNQ